MLILVFRMWHSFSILQNYYLCQSGRLGCKWYNIYIFLQPNYTSNNNRWYRSQISIPSCSARYKWEWAWNTDTCLRTLWLSFFFRSGSVVVVFRIIFNTPVVRRQVTTQVVIVLDNAPSSLSVVIDSVVIIGMYYLCSNIYFGYLAVWIEGKRKYKVAESNSKL